MKREARNRKIAQLRILPEKAGERIFRDEVDTAPDWEMDADERKVGPRTTFPDGIYIVTVSENTPGEWIDLSWRATIAGGKQHPNQNLDFLPADNYDSAIAVYNGRVVGGALASLERKAQYRWRPTLKTDGTAYSYEELTGEAETPASCPPVYDPTLQPFRPTVLTIWVHQKYRRLGIGRQLVTALAEHFNRPVDQIGIRLPLWSESVRMIRAMGLDEIICGF